MSISVGFPDQNAESAQSYLDLPLKVAWHLYNKCCPSLEVVAIWPGQMAIFSPFKLLWFTFSPQDKAYKQCYIDSAQKVSDEVVHDEAQAITC